MNPSSFSWLLSVKSTANQMNVASTSPSLAMSSSVSTPVASSTPSPRKATAVESSPSVAADAPQRDHARRRSPSTIFSSRLSGPSAASACRAAAGASGVAVTSGADELVEQQRQQHHRRRASAPRPRAATSRTPISTPNGLRDLGAERVGGHRGQPERRRQRQARDAREHQEARRARRRDGSPGLRAGGLGQRERQRVEHAGARGVARKRRRDHGVHEEDAVGRGRAWTGRTGSPRAWPMRWPRPHFTTARATRNATTMSRIVPLANPA